MAPRESGPAGADAMFDRVVVVDWSANSAPKRGVDSIWVSCHTSGDATWTLNVPTRAQAVEVLRRTLSDPRPRLRCLLAVDFSLGFPAGTARAVGLTGTPWAAMWAELGRRLVDDARNRNNRFAVASDLNREIGDGPGPFWGCPPSQRSPWLTPTKVEPVGLPTWRATEQRLRDAGRRPFSSWQLLGAGAVGSQSLLGIARLRQLVAELEAVGHRTYVWPLSTGLVAPAIVPGDVVIAEVWPSMIALPPDADRVRDEVQVVSVGRHLVALDRDRRLDGLFNPAIAADVRPRVVDEEGWVLGAEADAAAG